MTVLSLMIDGAYVLDMRTDRASGIVNGPNAYPDRPATPRYTLDLRGKVVTVSVGAVEVVNAHSTRQFAGRQSSSPADAGYQLL